MADRKKTIEVTADTSEATAKIGDIKRITRREFDEMSRDAETTSKEVSSAFKKMGIRTEKDIKKSSDEARKNYEKIKNSGTASANDIKRAHNVMTARIKANNRELQTSTNKLSGFFKGFKSKILGIGVAIAGLGFTLLKAFDFAEAGAKLLVQKQAFNSFAKSINADGEEILKSLKEVSKGTITESDLIASAGRALLLGLSPDKLIDLLKIARASSKITGDTVTKSFDDITLGVGRTSKQILDNLGILLNANTAYEQYALKINKSADELTDQEKKLAVLNATAAAGAVIIKGVGDDYLSTADKIARMKTQVNNLMDRLKVKAALIFDRAEPAIRAFGEAVLSFVRDIAPDFAKAMQFIGVLILQSHIGFLQVSKGISLVGRAVALVTDKIGITKDATTIFDFAIKELDGRIAKARGSVAKLTEKLDDLEKQQNESIDKSEKMTKASEEEKDALSDLKDEQDRNTSSTHTSIKKCIDDGCDCSGHIGTPKRKVSGRKASGRKASGDDPSLATLLKVRGAKDRPENQPFVGPPTINDIVNRGGVISFNSKKEAEEFMKAFRRFNPGLKFKEGGDIPGYGGGDKVPALLEAGEHVIRKESVRKLGRAAAEAFNRGDVNSLISNLLRTQNVQKFAEGGEVKGGSGASVNLNLRIGNKSFPTKTTKSTADSLVKTVRKTNIIYGRGSYPY